MRKVIEMCNTLGVINTPKTEVTELSKAIKSNLLRLFVKKDIEGFTKKLKEAPDVLGYEMGLDAPIREFLTPINDSYLATLQKFNDTALTTGAVISLYVFDILGRHPLTPKQKGQMVNIRQGTWDPEGIDLSETLLAIRDMDARGESTDLIYLLKELTPPPSVNEVSFMIDGVHVTFAQFREDWRRELNLPTTCNI